ncbi:MAG: deoxynucleoside kinase [Anaerolineaceae bacterium]
MYFSIEGVIGVGKTTLTRLLKPSFKANILLEVFEENPFLTDFYSDRARYAFQTQIFFLLSRYHQQKENVGKLIADGAHLISDYTFEKDALFARINLQGDELEMYYRVHEALAEKVPHPDLVVYLRAGMDTLLQRISMRDRPYERQIERAYLEMVHNAYEQHFVSRREGTKNVLVIDTDQVDYVRSMEDLHWIENRIRQTLQLTPFQPELPLASRGKPG